MTSAHEAEVGSDHAVKVDTDLLRCPRCAVTSDWPWFLTNQQTIHRRRRPLLPGLLLSLTPFK
jgi:hypothetical protein